MTEVFAHIYLLSPLLACHQENESVLKSRKHGFLNANVRQGDMVHKISEFTLALYSHLSQVLTMGVPMF